MRVPVHLSCLFRTLVTVAGVNSRRPRVSPLFHEVVTNAHEAARPAGKRTNDWVTEEETSGQRADSELLAAVQKKLFLEVFRHFYGGLEVIAAFTRKVVKEPLFIFPGKTSDDDSTGRS
jgi:hypothetical protein